MVPPRPSSTHFGGLDSMSAKSPQRPSSSPAAQTRHEVRSERRKHRCQSASNGASTRRATRRVWAHRHQARGWRGRGRRGPGSGGGGTGLLLPHSRGAGRKRRRGDDRGTGRRSSASTSLHERSRRAVRNLYAGHDHGRDRARPLADARRGEDCARGESLPVHRLLCDLPRGAEVASDDGRYAECGAMRTAISSLEVRSAKSLDEALTILRDDQRTLLAGATDLYVALNFGTLEPRRFLDIWAVNELRDISMKGKTLVIGALATYTSLIRSPLVAAHLPMLVE